MTLLATDCVTSGEKVPRYIFFETAEFWERSEDPAAVFVLLRLFGCVSRCNCLCATEIIWVCQQMQLSVCYWDYLGVSADATVCVLLRLFGCVSRCNCMCAAEIIWVCQQMQLFLCYWDYLGVSADATVCVLLRLFGCVVYGIRTLFCKRMQLPVSPVGHLLDSKKKKSLKFISTFAKLRKSTISVMFVHPSACSNRASTGRILMTFDIWAFFENL
jgi:hypothetical protein